VDSRSWKRKEVAGPFFIYKRKAKPFYSFIIANRHSPDDFIQPILQTIRFELKAPFIFVNVSESKLQIQFSLINCLKFRKHHWTMVLGKRGVLENL
jgi:hypothetical protein